MSGQHALIAWTGKHWAIRDLGSRNGTFVETKRLAEGERVAIRARTKLTFATTRMLVLSVTAPVIRAASVNRGAERVGDGDGVLTLSESPLVVVVPDGDGWMLDAATLPVRPVRDQEVISVAGEEWLLELPPLSDTTDSTERVHTLSLGEATMTFHVSSDEAGEYHHTAREPGQSAGSGHRQVYRLRVQNNS